MILVELVHKMSLLRLNAKVHPTSTCKLRRIKNDLVQSWRACILELSNNTMLVLLLFVYFVSFLFVSKELVVCEN